MEEIKTQVKINCDLGFNSLLHAIYQFDEVYKFIPKMYYVEFSMEDVINISRLADFIKGNFKEITTSFKETCFRVNRNFNEGYWELIGYSDEFDKKFIIYSEGA